MSKFKANAEWLFHVLVSPLCIAWYIVADVVNDIVEIPAFYNHMWRMRPWKK